MQQPDSYIVNRYASPINVGLKQPGGAGFATLQPHQQWNIMMPKSGQYCADISGSFPHSPRSVCWTRSSTITVQRDGTVTLEAIPQPGPNGIVGVGVTPPTMLPTQPASVVNQTTNVITLSVTNPSGGVGTFRLPVGHAWDIHFQQAGNYHIHVVGSFAGSPFEADLHTPTIYTITDSEIIQS